MWFWPCIVDYVEIKCQLDATDEFLLQILLLAQHVSGIIMPIIRSSRVLYNWLLPVVFGASFWSCRYRQLENQAPNTTGSNHLYNNLELLMMGIMVPETCWASNKLCNKNHLLHLVGILFPHIKTFRYFHNYHYPICHLSSHSISGLAPLNLLPRCYIKLYATFQIVTIYSCVMKPKNPYRWPTYSASIIMILIFHE